MIKCDLVIIGAGPAGMAAATTAARQGATVTVLDEQALPGGQIYRNVQTVDTHRATILGPDYLAGKVLADQMGDPCIRHEKSATVWRVSEDGTVTYSQSGQARQVHGKYLIIATGALERPVPIPGWTLPGVMTVGAAQILLKTSGLIAQDAVLVGSGPLLYLVAAQMTASGTPLLAMVETQTAANLWRGVAHFGGALKGWKTLGKGLGLLARIRKAGVRRYTGISAIHIDGGKQATAVRFQHGGKSVSLPCSTVLLHQGVVPNTQMSRSLRLKHTWNTAQHCFQPILDAWGETSSKGIFIAGDGAGIGGARAAEYAGQICAYEILNRLNILDRGKRDDMAAPILSALKRETAVRPFLDCLYAPPDEVLRPEGSTIVCRCEEVTAAEIRRHAKNGCVGPNQTKAFSRTGMGPCQGRYCGLTVTEILAAEHSQTQDATGSYRIRSPLKPVSLGEISALSDKGL